ncbi:thermonuclease family protein [Gemella sp. GH3]|uniref:thermonuclease family protein n=1 Tax=unclassified Gemella TaxID=2624949 RepID=UPI0015CF9E1B|nr:MULTISPECIES: thermonuclease family protein [unclassified Gemella]MBF0713892.1 thermonuclease family protein [Gemella sp. GH3.1]NYS50844.1 thermonuclease family protein [Gemella sp. GH3]
MNKKLYSILTTIFTIAIIIFVYLYGGNLFNSTKSNTITINGIQVTGDTTRYPVQFVRKIDGDTIKVKFNNQDLTVRYLLVDTPETVKANTEVQPYGPEASDLNEKILKNAKKVEIEFDVYEKKDKYDRALAYVYADGKSVQEQLLKEGLAEIKYVKEPDTRYLNNFKKAQNEAKSNKKNLWSN